jgi:NAD(P)-dependent dehydrogenase (short-subunit alcohol dehydrogenase family)
MVTAAVAGLGRLDYLINNAGTPASALPVDIKDLDRLDEAFWQAILSTNLLGPFRCAHAVAPGLVASPWRQDWPEERRPRTLAKTVLGRLIQPEEIAEAMLYLAAGATMMTGQTLVVDGGRLV